LEIILDSITSETNYAKWKGDAGGVSKETLCGEVNSLMKAASIQHRNNGDIWAEICELQTIYNKARDWLKHTGEGIRKSDEENAEATIQGML